MATTLLSSFLLAVASALVPWINGELVLLGFVGRATPTSDLVQIVVSVTAGQVAGKSFLFWVARRARRMPSPKVAAAVARWRDRAERRPLAALTTVFASATLGFPPPCFIAMAAGAAMVEFGAFLPVVAFGRLIHFGAVALVPRLVGHLFL